MYIYINHQAVGIISTYTLLNRLYGEFLFLNTCTTVSENKSESWNGNLSLAFISPYNIILSFEWYVCRCYAIVEPWFIYFD